MTTFTERLAAHLQARADQATTHYQGRWNPTLYMEAITDLDGDLHAQLVDDASAIAGHPRNAMSRYPWNEDQARFLCQFIPGEGA